MEAKHETLQQFRQTLKVKYLSYIHFVIYLYYYYSLILVLVSSGQFFLICV